MGEGGLGVEDTPSPLEKKWSVVLALDFNACYQKVTSNAYQARDIRIANRKLTKQKFTLKLSDARKLFNTGNGDIDAIMQKYSDISSCKNVHDTMIKVVQTAKWAFRVNYGEMNIRGFVGQ